MREAVTEIGGLAATSAAAAAPPQAMGKVWAISERPVTLTDSPENGRIRALLATAATPPQSDINAALGTSNGNNNNNTPSSSSAYGARSKALVNHHGGFIGSGVLGRVGAWRKSGLYGARPVMPTPPFVASPGGSVGFPGGLTAREVGKILPLPELGSQPYSDRRELLCLTGAGLQVLTRLRPVDLLYDLLAQNYTEGVSWRNRCFGFDGGRGGGGLAGVVAVGVVGGLGL